MTISKVFLWNVWNVLMRMHRKKKNMTFSVHPRPWVGMLKSLLGQSAQHQVQVLWIPW